MAKESKGSLSRLLEDLITDILQQKAAERDAVNQRDKERLLEAQRASNTKRVEHQRTLERIESLKRKSKPFLLELERKTGTHPAVQKLAVKINPRTSVERHLGDHTLYYSFPFGKSVRGVKPTEYIDVNNNSETAFSETTYGFSAPEDFHKRVRISVSPTFKHDGPHVACAYNIWSYKATHRQPEGLFSRTAYEHQRVAEGDFETRVDLNQVSDFQHRFAGMLAKLYEAYFDYSQR